MLTIFLAIAPVFALILMGYGLRRGGIPSTEFWNLNDRLVYWVLMPALFFSKISAADLSGGLGDYAILLYAGFFTAILCGWLFGRGVAAAKASSLLQGSARFNTFIGLAIAEAVFGMNGLQVAVLGSALLVPVVNVTVVTLMTRQLGGGGKSILRGLLKNPLILSIGVGVLFNLAGLNEVPVLHEIARILGDAALPIMLLCVGANLQIRGLTGSVRIIGLSMIGKFVINPAAVVLAALFLGPDLLTFQIALVFAALPTGVASYTLAREMQGDAPLMASIITTQTLLSFVTLPLTLLVGQAILSFP
ncbi:AEC family transporter [Pelagivirga sediminicola]|uniref:AEC family transporter n=1 Tax=Pelagivirga sediminicola TaxID=2170575 RepID=A0A2T7G8B0_9RHOB|nr:AEC family transporter [Pelagivirga sediminicola]PVA10636.1 AEC family transporter [Pelagivirga sediminicola]